MASVGVGGDGGLLERDRELGLIGALVQRARGGEGSLLVVEGQAGVGKTELLRAAGELGGAEGLRVLRTRGLELDSAFAFGVVRQLLEREVADDPELLTGGAEPAAAVFAAAGGDARAEEGVFSSLQGLHWLVVNLAPPGSARTVVRNPVSVTSCSATTWPPRVVAASAAVSVSATQKSVVGLPALRELGVQTASAAVWARSSTATTSPGIGCSGSPPTCLGSRNSVGPDCSGCQPNSNS